MKIDKRFFEDVLSGKLKGKFIFRNVHNVYGVELKPNHTCIQKSSINGFYIIRMPSLLFNVVNTDGKSVYGCTRHKKECNNDLNYDIIDFIPDTDMKENELTIEIPDGFEIDKKNSTFEKIVFKKKDTKPRSWEEYCRLQKESRSVGYFINSYCDVSEKEWSTFYEATNEWRYIIPSKELAEAFLAMMQLMSLRHDWIHKWSIDNGMTNDWEPDWKNYMQWKASIICINNNFDVTYCGLISSPLSFPTEEITIDFMNCFKDLLEIAKPLI